MTEQAILDVAVEGEIEILTLNRPDRLNALNQAMAEGLLDYFERKRRDRTCRVILVRGAGRGL